MPDDAMIGPMPADELLKMLRWLLDSRLRLEWCDHSSCGCERVPGDCELLRELAVMSGSVSGKPMAPPQADSRRIRAAAMDITDGRGGGSTDAEVPAPRPDA